MTAFVVKKIHGYEYLDSIGIKSSLGIGREIEAFSLLMSVLRGHATKHSHQDTDIY